MSTAITKIKEKIETTKRELQELGAMRPGKISRQYRNPQEKKETLLPDQLYLPDEKPLGIPPPGAFGRHQAGDRQLQAVQETHRPMGGVSPKSLPTSHATGIRIPCPHLIRQNTTSILGIPRRGKCQRSQMRPLVRDVG